MKKSFITSVHGRDKRSSATETSSQRIAEDKGKWRVEKNNDQGLI